MSIARHSKAPAEMAAYHEAMATFYRDLERARTPTLQRREFSPYDRGEGAVRVAVIVSAVAAHYGLTIEQILSSRRMRIVARPRQIVMYLARLHGRSYPEIAAVLRRRDHTTIMHGERVIAGLIQTDPQIAADVERLRQEVQQ